MCIRKIKKVIGSLGKALYDIEPDKLKGQLAEIFDPKFTIRMAFPFEDVDGPKELYERVFAPLLRAIPDMLDGLQKHVEGE